MCQCSTGTARTLPIPRALKGSKVVDTPSLYCDNNGGGGSIFRLIPRLRRLGVLRRGAAV